MTTPSHEPASALEPDVSAPESYPRQEAATRRFRLGLPRAFRPAPDGRRVAFVRSAGGRDPVGSLWIAEADGTGALVERIVVDARTLVRDEVDLPAAEKARRERLRETTAGITAFSTDDEVTRAVFSLDGTLVTVDLLGSGPAPVEVQAPGAVVDPRLSPDGRIITFVSDRSLFAVPADASAPARMLAAPDSDTVTWGLADFVAAEELDRVRGLWWLSDSNAILAERVDDAPVAVRWIADPARPEREPVPHRYPAAGTDNPEARLFLIPVTGAAPMVEVAWDRATYPYLATVEPTPHGTAIVSVLSRDQRRQLILSVDGAGATSVVRERVAEPWITLQPGVPQQLESGEVLEIVADVAADTFRLVCDDAPLTPPGLQVTGVVHADEAGIIVTAQATPEDQGVFRVTKDGTVQALVDEPGIHAVAAGRGGLVVVSASPTDPQARVVATLDHASGPIASLAERPVVAPLVGFHRVTDRDLSCAVLLPTGHVPGSGPLPVVMAPYGGPHHARVVHAAAAFTSDQWLADQGFAVVVVDGSGTPGRGPAFEYEVNGDLATGVLADQVAALQALADLYPDLDLTRVGITGWSFGGYLAALAVLDRPDIFHAAVAGAPVTDWALYDTGYTERYLGLPQEQPVAYASTSLLARADRLERPLLIIHGLADDNVLVAHSLQLSSALLAAGRAHAVIPLSGVTHMTPQEVVAENLLRLEVGFLADSLG